MIVGAMLLGGTAFAAPRPFHGHAPRGYGQRFVCGATGSGSARCLARVLVKSNGSPLATSGPNGYGPLDLLGAYSIPSNGGAGQTVAIVDAYNDPNASSDLNAYRAKFGIAKLATCATPTSAGPCFTKVNQNGSTSSLPRSNASWSEEISLDLDMVSAIAPNAKIMLVEASSASYTSLGTAVNTAAKLHATEISNSYGGSESSSDPSYDTSYYDHAGIAVTASSGDSGYGVEYPAASRFVTAVGGTSLQVNASHQRVSETAWSGAGSGCSAWDAKPSWQTDPGCANRTVADVSADADPNTGVAVYDSYGESGWLVFGGTSVASPIIASVYADAGNASSTVFGSFPYGHDSPTNVNDITSGSNGSCGSYLCNAATPYNGPSYSGYDGPTGLGTPHGTGGF